MLEIGIGFDRYGHWSLVIGHWSLVICGYSPLFPDSRLPILNA